MSSVESGEQGDLRRGVAGRLIRYLYPPRGALPRPVVDLGAFDLHPGPEERKQLQFSTVLACFPGENDIHAQPV